MTATIHPTMTQAPAGSPVWHTVADAAEATGCSPTTIRRRAKEAGVRKIAGGSVAGMVEIEHRGRRGYMPFAE